MGTNYYRIPTQEEMVIKKQQLIEDVAILSLDPSFINDNFSSSDESYNRASIWDKFTSDTLIHLGKRSSGWKFIWNFHKEPIRHFEDFSNITFGKYYSNKEELFSFIRSGRVVDEYGELQEVEEFIQMALDWGQPDGLCVDEKYCLEHGYSYNYLDEELEGLRVSSSDDFS